MPEAGLPIVLGVDAGGSKTDAVVGDADGAVLGFATAGCGNWEMVGLDETQAALTEAVDAALAQAGVDRAHLAAATFALAGLDWAGDRHQLEPVVASLRLGGRRLLINDAFAALRAGCRERHGAVSIAGTGSVTAARNRAGETFRTMAIGYGEQGGASDLVRDGLDAIARARHGQAPPTLLEERYLAALGLSSTDELFERLTRQGLQLSHRLAPLVLATADSGDQAAVAIARGMGEHLADSVAGGARCLAMADDAFEVVLAGGVHRAANAILAGAFTTTLRKACPRAQPVRLLAPAAAGAVLLALELVVSVEAELHDRLVQRMIAQSGRQAAPARERAPAPPGAGIGSGA